MKHGAGAGAGAGASLDTALGELSLFIRRRSSGLSSVMTNQHNIRQPENTDTQLTLHFIKWSEGGQSKGT